MWSPTRSALAIAVSAGFTAPMLGKKLVSTTYRLSSSCALQSVSRTEEAGSDPKRTVPAWWATPVVGVHAQVTEHRLELAVELLLRFLVGVAVAERDVAVAGEGHAVLRSRQIF